MKKSALCERIVFLIFSVGLIVGVFSSSVQSYCLNSETSLESVTEESTTIEAIMEAETTTEEVTEAETVETTTAPVTESAPASYGWSATGYCSCYYCTGYNHGEHVFGAAGVELIAGYSCAADPSILPYGTKILITYSDGRTEERRVDDCGGAVKGRIIDLYQESHEAAAAVGRQTIGVEIIG